MPRVLSVWVAPLTGATPFLLAQERCAKEGHPDIRVSLRETPLAPVLLRGPAYKGHPWPFKPLAASMRLIPLRNTSTRPPEGDLAVVCGIALQEQKPDATDFMLRRCRKLANLSPSGGRVESPWKGLSDMDVARAVMGQGWPFTACPWSGDGAEGIPAQPGPYAGVCFFAYFLCTSKESESPVRGETYQARQHAKG